MLFFQRCTWIIWDQLWFTIIIGFGPNIKKFGTKKSPVSNSWLATTVSWQCQKHRPRSTTILHVSQMQNHFLCHEWNGASLFLSQSVGFKSSRVLMTRVSFVNKACKWTSYSQTHFDYNNCNPFTRICVFLYFIVI